MIVVFKVIANYDIIYDIIFVRQKYDIGQKMTMLDLTVGRKGRDGSGTD